MKGVSVIICYHNSIKRLPITLKYLSNQITHRSLNWEIILVDNNSTDNSSNFAIEFLEQSDVFTSYKVINEKRIGLVYARESGAMEANYDYLIFCDDDNWLCNNYIQQVYDFFEILPPNVGIIGGIGEAFFQNDSLNGKGILASATGKQCDFEGDITDKTIVYGAGMAIKRNIFTTIKRRNIKFLLTDRIGKKMSSGGDSEICMISVLLGYRIHYYSTLHFFHYMPNYRLSKEHCTQALVGLANSKFYLLLYSLILKSKKTKLIILLYPFIELYNSLSLVCLFKKNNQYSRFELKLIGFERFKNVFFNLFIYYKNINYFFFLNEIKKEING